MIREPLVHFLVVGAILATGASLYRIAMSPQRIVVDQTRADALSAAFMRDFGRPPTGQEAEALIARFVREEVLFREGRAMGLDQDDEIVRRRLVQKAAFVLEDQKPPAEPTQAQLRTWFEAHAADYRTAERASFSHVYFSPDVGGEADARARAERAGPGLAAGVVGLGDAFPGSVAYEQQSPNQVVNLFGRSPFADAVFAAPLGDWSEPVRSGYGWHRLRVQWRETGRTPEFAQVRDAVRDDYLRQQRQSLNVAALAKVESRFRIERTYRIPGP